MHCVIVVFYVKIFFVCFGFSFMFNVVHIFFCLDSIEFVSQCVYLL